MGPVSVHGYELDDGPLAGDAAGRFQRAAEREQFLFRQAGDHPRPGDGDSVPEQRDPEGAAEPERTGDSEGMADPEPDNADQRNADVVYGGEASAEPAKGHAGGGFQPNRKAAPAVPPEQLRVLGVSADRRRHAVHAEVLRPAEPDQLAEPRVDGVAEQS